jgi:hypothetical protein
MFEMERKIGGHMAHDSNFRQPSYGKNRNKRKIYNF